MMGAGGELFVFWFSRTHEIPFPGAFLRFAVVVHKDASLRFATNFIIQQKSGVAMAPGCMGPTESLYLPTTQVSQICKTVEGNIQTAMQEFKNFHENELKGIHLNIRIIGVLRTIENSVTRYSPSATG